MKIQVIHGPNLNLLGRREPDIYGSETLDDIDAKILDEAKRFGAEVRFFQSNVEGELVTAVQDAWDWAEAVIINPGAYTHTSIALRDAISAIEVPVIEVHLSNVHARERFRRHSYISPVAVGQISGFGPQGYVLALHAALGLEAGG
ncbi:MAG: type II 3-dehydroquinate dehydratase [Candidatus Hydrogenedentota bacterium]|nr:MAG: type II 3-dehydroquinate dehydratase [Candidatus Hydrogenedentota bacterium]